MERIEHIRTPYGTKGIEIYFEKKPLEETINTLKIGGYRWHNLKKCWYAKETPCAEIIANALVTVPAEQAEQAVPSQVSEKVSEEVSEVSAKAAKKAAKVSEKSAAHIDKYEILTLDLLQVVKACEKFRDADDGGTCNRDITILSLKNWNRAKTEEAIENAGLRCFYFANFHGWGIVPPIWGQALRNEMQAEEMTKQLKKMGYTAHTYSRAD